MNIKRSDHKDIYYGVEVSDPYEWMEDMQSGEVKEFIEYENGQTEKYLSKIPYRNKIRSRLTELA
ncbi:MAG: hypothetical protein KBF96_09150, partial [Ignavibacteria bacterium]|nr:hypothetical protein [Ignavibacteria bacterium]